MESYIIALGFVIYLIILYIHGRVMFLEGRKSAFSEVREDILTIRKNIDKEIAKEFERQKVKSNEQKR